MKKFNYISENKDFYAFDAVLLIEKNKIKNKRIKQAKKLTFEKTPFLDNIENLQNKNFNNIDKTKLLFNFDENGIANIFVLNDKLIYINKKYLDILDAEKINYDLKIIDADSTVIYIFENDNIIGVLMPILNNKRCDFCLVENKENITDKLIDENIKIIIF